MSEINYLALVISVLAAFVAGAVWNQTLFGDLIMKLHDPNWTPDDNDDNNPPAWKLLVELTRILIVALVLCWFITGLNIIAWTEVLQLGFVVWIGFPIIMLTGAVVWEDMPLKLAAIHAGDWLVKILLIVLILSRGIK